MTVHNEFSKGFLIYETVQAESPVSINVDQWDDGYLAYSAVEERLSGIKGKDADLQRFFSSHTGDPERGYLMEADLWRTRDGVYEEISIEREDDIFFVQRWVLYTNGQEHTDNNALTCYYRYTETLPRPLSIEKGLFNENELRSIEVVVPERRLHLFITTTEGGNGDGQKE